ncbi:MAG: multicopper oxidase domain-containing protein [Flavobacteriaceae bacterium]|nr:multicopper oxidase domain-containing protein [Flavobacteriaceae bacterium]
MKKSINIVSIFLLLISISLNAQEEKSVEGNIDNLPVKEYTLTLRQEKVNMSGKEVMAMTINGSIPGPVLEFTEGEYAVINVKNEMDVESSIHWHGLLLPNFYDGVPHLTTPPIPAGKSFKYEFALKHSGTYWYHSHTMLQEQRGIFGSFIIHPKKKTLEYDSDLVLMLSDWTNEKPMEVLRNLKRGTEWYNFRKGTATPLNQVIKRGAFGAQMKFWKGRMEGADIADIYYDAFLINGKQSIEYPEFKAGEKVRLRIIDAAASTNFWMTFGGEDPLLVANDGVDVVPIKKNKTFIAIAEAYDFIVTIPENGKIEFKITAQDGSGTASAFLGTGKILKAESIERPDKIGMMKKMAKMDMKMGAYALKFRPKIDNRYEMKEKFGMQMKGKKNDKMNEGMNDEMKDGMKKSSKMKNNRMDMPNDSMQMKSMDKTKMMEKGTMKMEEMNIFSEYNYDYLKSPEKTNFSKDIPVKEILLNLTGNMQRYIWSMDGVPLSETDVIKIKENQVTRITLNNLTMMHHPMHLHGHFFRVLNKNGDYSPLKHTVNVPPMEEITIEFFGNEYGDWFFHCHVLYHVMGGMARVFTYETPRDKRMENYPVSVAIAKTDKYYSWGLLDVASNMAAINLTTSNIRNQFNASFEYGWNKILEAEFTYEYYLHDYLTVFGGVNTENEENNLTEFNTVAVAGIRYFTPYMFSLDARIDSELRPRISLGRSFGLFPRFSVFGYYEYQFDVGLINDLPTGINFESETVWSAGAEYMLSRNFSLMASYDNRFGAGGGLSWRF